MSNYSSNDVFLIGHVGKDPFIAGEGENLVATIRLATNDAWRDKEGNLNAHTDWHDVVYFGKAAQSAKNYVKKGMMLHVRGKLKNTQWKDKDGVEHFKTQVFANGFIGFLDKKLTEETARTSDA